MGVVHVCERAKWYSRLPVIIGVVIFIHYHYRFEEYHVFTPLSCASQKLRDVSRYFARLLLIN